MIKNKALNLLGQLRVYSIIDLIILLIALGANTNQFIGALLLHLGFILFLESRHKHKYRIAFPKFLWLIFAISGLILYNKISAIGFILFSLLYTKKNNSSLGLLSPLFRGLQSYFLSAGIVGFVSPLSALSGLLLGIRNFTGDLRDIVKDKKEGTTTLPLSLGFKKSWKYIHLISLLLTTFVWWYLSGISIIWLIIAYILQIVTYNLTPR